MAITREYENGDMVVKDNGTEIRRFTPAQLQSRADKIQARIDRLSARKTEMLNHKASAEASA